jgi:hypothetical protein
LYDSNYDYAHDNNNSYFQQNNCPSNSNNYYQSNSSFQEPRQREIQEKDSLSKFTKDIKDTHQTMREIVEIMNMSKQLQPPSSSLGQLAGTLGATTMPLFGGIKDASQLVNYYYAYEFSNILIKNKNIGGRGRICDKCSSYWLEISYDNEEIRSLMKNKEPSFHKCNPKEEEANAQNAQDIQSKKTYLENALISLILWMIISWRCFGLRNICLKAEELAATTSPYSSPCPTQRKNSNNNNHHPTQIVDDSNSRVVQQQQQPPHLQPQPQLQPQEQSERKAEPQEQPQPEPQQASSSSPSFLVKQEEEQEKGDNNNFINIDLATIKEKSWLYDVIKEIVYEKKSLSKTTTTAISIDKDGLIDFLKTAKTTYGVFKAEIDGSTRYFFIYLYVQ